MTADTPRVLPAFAGNEPRNRLGLARWLTSPQNPLSARGAGKPAFPSSAGGGPSGKKPESSTGQQLEQLSFFTILPAFVLSELKTAFQLGFLLFLPFLLVDLVVSAVLVSMGMIMLPPTLVSLPLKILIFVLVDGWSLVVGQLLAGIQGG